MPKYKHPLYRMFRSLLQRCLNPNHPSYPHYGGRGITVCERWRSAGGFERFLADMGDRPEGTSIDRVDNERGYEPANCRWATGAQQRRNTRCTVLITIDGVTQCMKDWCDASGVDTATAHGRIRNGWDPARAVTEPADKKRWVRAHHWRRKEAVA
jgi:hypothetical protein